MTLQQKQYYRELLNSIDFFSQKLHIDQIIRYGYQIFEDLTLPEAGAVYTINDSATAYEARYSMGYELVPQVAFNDIYNELARKNGFLLDNYEVQSRYFKDEFLKTLTVDVILPLIIEDKLFGFIVAVENHKDSGIKNREFLNRFNDLLNLSLEKAENFERTHLMQQEINKRKFNLDSIAQTLKILMTALDQNYIQTICLDVVRELTASSVTSIALEVSPDYLAVSAYRDIVNNKSCFLNLSLFEDAKPSQIIYHVKDDYEALKQIFENTDDLETLEAEYVVLLVKEKILGCITIGKPVSDVPYDQQLLEQIESLASMMYIAINNANQFKKLQEEQKLLSEQLKGMKHLDRSISIINGADTLEELCSHVVDTLRYGFGVKEGFMVVCKDGQPLSYSVNGQGPSTICEEVFNYLKTIDSSHVEYVSPEKNPIVTDRSNCFICLPILKGDYEQTCMGHVVIHELDKALTESRFILFETLANSISPIIKQFLVVNMYRSSYIERPEIRLSSYYERYKADAEYFDIPYYIYTKKRMSLFSGCHHDQVVGTYDQVDVGGYSVVFTNEPITDSSYTIVETNDFDMLIDHLEVLHQ
jgi:hypothetical protein